MVDPADFSEEYTDWCAEQVWQKERDADKARIAELEADQADWRKGVALIASALGEKDPPDLSCARIAEVALNMRAALEKYVLDTPIL